MIDRELKVQTDAFFYAKTFGVSIGCIILALAGSYALYRDIHQFGKTGLGKPVAKVIRSEAKVRRKASGSYVWNPISKDDDLFKKDSVQTGENSIAALVLTNGSLLDISENSLVVMDDSSDLSLRFLRGSAVVHQEGGDKKISVGKDGKAHIEELPIRLVKPEAQIRYFIPLQSTRSVTLGWVNRANTGQDSYNIQVSLDKKFIPSVTQTVNVDTTKVHEYKINLKPGIYYWRLVDKEKPVSDVRQFSVLGAVPLAPIWPQDIQVAPHSATDQSVQFRWVLPKSRGLEDSDFTQAAHGIEISAHSDFKKILQSESIDPGSGSSLIKINTAGTLFWRIKSTYSDFTLYSSVSEFSFKTDPKEVPTVLPAPRHPQPQANAVLNPLKDPTSLQVSWYSVENAQEYEVVIYGIKGGVRSQKPIKEVKTKNIHFSFKDLPAGDYVWSVRGIDRKNQPGEAVALTPFTITYGEVLKAPEIISPEVQ